MGDDGMRWDGIAALGYEQFQRTRGAEQAARRGGYSARSWEDLPRDERVAWIAAAKEIARVAFIAASGG